MKKRIGKKGFLGIDNVVGLIVAIVIIAIILGVIIIVLWPRVESLREFFKLRW